MARRGVAPFAGAWIEMFVRWLRVACVTRKVAPFAGAWIEMPEEWRIRKTYPGRSLRGSVD